MFDVRFHKALEANACEGGGSAGVICVVYLYVCFLFPIRNWRQGQSVDPFGQLRRPISRILRHVFRRSLFFPVD